MGSIKRFFAGIFKAILVLFFGFIALVFILAFLSEYFNEYVEDSTSTDYDNILEDAEDVTDEYADDSELDNEDLDYQASYFKTSARNYQQHKRKGDEYQFEYVYRDLSNRPSGWRWTYDKEIIDDLNNRFGLPEGFFEKSFNSDAEIRRIAREGFFKMEDRIVKPDYSALVKAYMPTMKPMYDILIQKLGKNATAEQMIMELARFCQDVPYKLPPELYKGKETNGLFPPYLALLKGWADCDTKCMIYASILGRDPRFKIVFITGPGHLLLGIRGVPKPYQDYVNFRGEKYILCEPVGPARLNFGEGTENAHPVVEIEPLVL